MGAHPDQVQSRFSGSQILRRPIVSIRRLSAGVRPHRSAAAILLLDRQAHAGRISPGDGYGTHVREMAARLPRQATIAAAVMATAIRLRCTAAERSRAARCLTRERPARWGFGLDGED